MSVCVSSYAFRPLTTYGDETWQGGRGPGPIISEGHQRSKVGSNFKLLRLSSNLGRVTLDRGRVQNAYWGGCPPRSQVTSKVRSNFRLLGLSSNLGRVMLNRGQVRNAYRGGRPLRSSEVKGQVKFQVARIDLKFGDGDARLRASVKCVSRRRMSSKVKWG